MQFTRLRLQGFKSFVDPTELVIAEGLTGVVGPNGCGKSNLLEALRWVMGENRAKAMRGDGMEDVIFAGASSRPPRNGASVDLLVDNRERRAPAAFNDADQIEITRRITRDIGSAYAVNGKTVRARDVQMLFADASTGAHSPALVRQGQIAELINAKPKARRRILEEAAGISGLYQRRHEAELKLNATEANLARVDDLIEGLDGQIRSLSRQAGEARRYRRIAEELRRAEAVLLWLRWQAADAGAREAEGALAEAVRAVGRAEAEARTRRRALEEAEEGIPALREESQVAAAVLQRLAMEREGLAEAEARAEAEIAALSDTARRLGEDLEREGTLERDAAAAEERLAAEDEALEAAAEGHEARLAAAEAAAEAAEAAVRQAEGRFDALSETAARLAAEVREADRKVSAANGARDKAGRELARSREELATAGSDAGGAADQAEAARRALTAAGDEATAAEEALTAATEAEQAASASLAAARSELGEAEGAAAAVTAERRGLESVLASDAPQADALVDRLAVEPGFEGALGAALGEDLRAPADPEEGATGWCTLGGRGAPATLPEGADRLAPRVGGEGAEVLAFGLAHVGVVAAEDGPRLQAGLRPGQRLVSREGDLWRWDGFRRRAGEEGSATAMRLEQRNRLAALEAQERDARAREAAAREAHAEAERASREASAAVETARRARREAERARTEAERRLSSAETAHERAEARRAALAEKATALEADLASAKTALAAAEAERAGLDDPATVAEAVEESRAAVSAARRALAEARSEADGVRREAKARDERRKAIARDRADWQRRRSNAGTRLSELEGRLAEAEASRRRAEEVPAGLAEKRARLEAEATRAEARRKAADDALAAAEAGRRDAEGALREAEAASAAAREAQARREAQREAAAERLATVAEALRDGTGREPAALLETLGIAAGDLPETKDAEADVTRLTRQRDALGAVNLRAEEDLAEVEAERAALAEEKADLDAAIARLRDGIGELNREGRTRLVEAFEAVNDHFSRLFRHLFGGGEARLVMVDSDDPLDAGLEILCQPPGKRLASLSLLSGGEQTLTALSLIFAVFLCNPAPICVLDEVDAPLDDSNVERFCSLLDEMVRLTRTRFLIITHHSITMSRMDRLFGVTMVERGVSQLVSVDLTRAAELVDG